MEGSPARIPTPPSALHLIQQRRFSDACTLLRQQLSQRPGDPLLLSQLGFVLSALGDKAAAVEVLRGAVGICPQDPRLLTNLAHALRDSGRTQEATDLYAQAATLAGDNLDIHLNQAMAHLDRGNPMKALEVAAKGLLRAPQDDRLHWIAAQGLQAMGRPAEAVIHYKEALQYRPQQRQLALGLSAALISCGQLQEAKGLLEDYLTQTPYDPELISNAAVVYTELGLLREAEAAYRAAVRLAPHLFVTHLNLSRFLQHCGRLEEARQNIGAALAIIPDAPEALQLSADLATGLDQMEQADRLLTALVERFPERVESLVALAQVRRHRGDIPTAHSLLKRSQTLSPYAPVLLSALAALDRQELADVLGSEEAIRAFDPVRVVRTDSLKLGEARSRLIEALRRDPSLLPQRPNRPTIGGSQSHELFGDPQKPLFGQLGRRIIERALANLSELEVEDRRFLTIPLNPDYIRISGWGVVLGKGGYQKPHTHPEGQMSGVLYLHIPVTCQRNTDAGNLRFPLQQGGCQQDFDISPKNEDIVFFPSYLWHSTVALNPNNGEERICLAFNLMPLGTPA